jgi:hypothetical protein
LNKPTPKFTCTTFACSGADLPAQFARRQIDIQDNGGRNHPEAGLVDAKGVKISNASVFAEGAEEVALATLKAIAVPGGPAVAVRIAQPDPETGCRINLNTGERRLVWLVGAKSPVIETVN